MSQISGKLPVCPSSVLRQPFFRQLSDNQDADVAVALRTFREGDHVRAFIISRDLEKKQLSLGLKPSYFTGDDVGSDSVDPQDDELGTANDVKTHGVPDKGGFDEEHSHLSSDEEELVGDGHDNDDAYDIPIQVNLAPSGPICSPKLREHQETNVSSLKIDGFQWFANDARPHGESQSESSDQSESEENSAEKRKRKKRKEIEKDATADMQTKTPDSNSDFERMLLGSPNSSYLWIQYMSFQLQLSEIDKARAIGKRAIQTIHFREEQEKLNIWIALLNLENVYGTDTTIEEVFKDAARHNDSKTIHLRLAAIFDESGKYEVR